MTTKAYFYDSGEQILKGDSVIYKNKAELVKNGAAGDTENPSVRLENGKAPKAASLTFIRRATSPDELAVAARAAAQRQVDQQVDDLNQGVDFRGIASC